MISDLGFKSVAVIVLLIVLPVFLLGPIKAEARITPEDIVNSKREVYESRVKNYSLENQQKLQSLSKKIALVNKKRTDELEKIMGVQAAILDEYEKRTQGQNKEQVEKARYWITFAHEAVAYQAAKVYIFNLSGEENIKNDTTGTINLFQGELNSTRSKVINSQQILQGILKK